MTHDTTTADGAHGALRHIVDHLVEAAHRFSDTETMAWWNDLITLNGSTHQALCALDLLATEAQYTRTMGRIGAILEAEYGDGYVCVA